MTHDGTERTSPGDAPTAPDRAAGPTPDHCRRCRYPLIGLAEDIPCPECGSFIRQVGPHRIIESNVLGAGSCIGIGALLLFVACAGFWPAILLVPFLGLTALIYGECEARSRRKQDLPRSSVTVVTSILGWLMFLPPLALLVFGIFVW